MLSSKLWAFYKKNNISFIIIETPVKLVNKNLNQVKLLNLQKNIMALNYWTTEAFKNIALKYIYIALYVL